MGRWLEKLAESAHQPTDKTDKSPFVSSVSTVQGPFEEKIAPKAAPAVVKLMLYAARDLKDVPLPRDDYRYIDDHLSPYSGRERHTLLTEYRERWIAAADTEPLEHCKVDVGRRAANTWLRTRLH